MSLMTASLGSDVILAVAIPILVVLAGILVFTTAARRDRAAAIGTLSRETRQRDRGQGRPLTDAVERPSGREIELAARLERQTAGAVVLAPPPPPPAPATPLDAEALGVTRRQFLNRGIVQMFGLGLGAFGAASLAFLWPESAGGFGAKVTLPDSLDEILNQIRAERKPYYYAKGRLYIAPYPKEGLTKAKAVYDPSIVLSMEQGIIALYQKCPHLGCRVPWCGTAQWFECPCHGSKYNRVGEKKGGPAPRGMDRFPVDIKGGKLTVNTGIIIQGPPIGTNTTGQEAEGPHCVTAGE